MGITELLLFLLLLPNSSSGLLILVVPFDAVKVVAAVEGGRERVGFES